MTYRVVMVPKDLSTIKWTPWYEGGGGLWAQFNVKDGSMARLRWDQRWRHLIQDKFCQRRPLEDGRVLWTVYVDNDHKDRRWTWKASGLVEVAYLRYLSDLVLSEDKSGRRGSKKATQSSPSAKTKRSSDQ